MSQVVEIRCAVGGRRERGSGGAQHARARAGSIQSDPAGPARGGDQTGAIAVRVSGRAAGAVLCPPPIHWRAGPSAVTQREACWRNPLGSAIRCLPRHHDH